MVTGVLGVQGREKVETGVRAPVWASALPAAVKIELHRWRSVKRLGDIHFLEAQVCIFGF